MGLYDEQIRQRTEYDDLTFTEACLKMTDAITGDRRANEFSGESKGLDAAIGDIFKYFRVGAPLCVEDSGESDDFEEKLDALFNPNGIMRRTVELKDNWYNNSYGPYLGKIRETGEMVAILPGKIFNLCYCDPQTGKKVRIDRKNCSVFEEEAYCFYKPLPMRRITVRDLMSYIVRQITPAEITIVLLFYLAATLLAMLVPKFTAILFGSVVEIKSFRLLAAAGVFMVCASISRIMVMALRSFVMKRISSKVSVNVQAATMMRILSLPPSFFRGYASGELSLVSGYVSEFCNLLIDTFIATSLESLFSIVYITQIFAYAKTLVIPSIIIVVISTGFNVISTLARMKQSKKVMEYTTKASGVGYSVLAGVEKIKLSGAEKRAFSKWADIYSKQASYEYNPPMFLKINSIISTAITSLGVILMYYLSARTGLTRAEYTAFLSAYGLFSGAFSALVSIVSKVANIRPTLDMCKPILNAVPEASEKKPVVKNVSGDISIENISFRYEEESPYIFEDFTLKIKRGDYIAIVGKTGCGKSTLVKLMLGFEQPTIGRVSIDGKNINNVDINSVRRHIGTVIQNGKLFHGTVLENILVAAPHATVDDAWEAAKIAGIDEDINKMPMGMYTIISEGQGGVSGGQKQRLLIARAIVGKPNLLIFDEATSALDNVTQKKVSDALAGLKCTRIVIAHRLSTIKDCDRIVVIDNGKIIQDGNYDTLIKEEGFFKALVERQMTENIEPERENV